MTPEELDVILSCKPLEEHAEITLRWNNLRQRKEAAEAAANAASKAVELAYAEESKAIDQLDVAAQDFRDEERRLFNEYLAANEAARYSVQTTFIDGSPVKARIVDFNLHGAQFEVERPGITRFQRGMTLVELHELLQQNKDPSGES